MGNVKKNRRRRQARNKTSSEDLEILVRMKSWRLVTDDIYSHYADFGDIGNDDGDAKEAAETIARVCR
eukprot:gene8084-biopygen19611